LKVAVEQLTEEARLIRMSLDELRDDVVWAARQVLAAGDAVAPGQLRRQYDPLAPDTAAPGSPPLDHHDSEDSEGVTYCCEAPALRWNGDPDYPGIACENCGYLVAENGSVTIWRDDPDKPNADGPAKPEQRQGSLFD
jgi:hypothetical protein